MQPEVVAWLALVCPAVFGTAMGLIAHWVFSLSAVRHTVGGFAKLVASMVGWMVGNGATLVGGVLLVSPAEALQGLPWGALLIAMGYLLGFGIGAITGYFIGHSTDRSLVGRLHRHLTGQQVETILLLYRYEVSNIDEAAARMRVSVEEFKELHLEAITILHRRAKSLANQIRSAT